MKTISFKQTESALFNLDSMRTKLLNEQYEQPEREDELQVRIDEVENLLEKLYFGRVTCSEWRRIQEIVEVERMNKDEIKKALVCCAKLVATDCPYYNNGKFSCCGGKMLLDARDLITEQEKEIDRLRAESKRFENNMKSVLEIEKKNVVKEFAEKLKVNAICLSAIEKYHVCNLIDELLKEYEE